jgi:hypothetical protein
MTHKEKVTLRMYIIISAVSAFMGAVIATYFG